MAHGVAHGAPGRDQRFAVDALWLVFRLLVLPTILAFGLLVGMAIIVGASPNALSAATCSAAEATSATAGFTAYAVSWQLDAMSGLDCDNSQASVTDSNFVGVNLPAGSPVVFTCVLHQGGAAPPQAATSIVVSGYEAQANVGGGGTPIWSTTLGSCGTTLNATTFTEYLTVDGTAGGSPRAGVVRIFVNMIDTNVGQTYNCNSDNAGTQTTPTGGTCTGAMNFQGVARSNPGFSAPNVTAAAPCAAGCRTYEGGDTITSSLTSNASSYLSANRGTTFADNTGTSNQLGSAYSLSIGALTQSVRIIGPSSNWVADGELSITWKESGGAGLTGFTGLSYWGFTRATVPLGITAPLTGITNAIVWDTLDRVTRTHANTGTPSVTVNGASSTVGNRGDTFAVSGEGWVDPRGANIPNNQPLSAWYQKAGDYRVASDFPSQSLTAGAQGAASSSIVATSAATVTSGLNYHKMVEEFDTTARTDAVLLNWGNSSGVLDVSASRQFGAVQESKLNSPFANASAFTIGVDVVYAQAQALTGANGAKVSGVTVTCQETAPNGNSNAPVTMGATDANGNSPIVQMENPAQGPSGPWVVVCSESDSGNSASFSASFFHKSPQNQNIQLLVAWNVTPVLPDNGSAAVNFSASLREWDNATDSVIAIFPDDVVRVTAFCYNNSDQRFDLPVANRSIMARSDGPTSSEFFNQTWASENVLSSGCFAWVTANFTQTPFLGGEGFTLIQNFTGNFSGNSSGLFVGNASGNFSGNFTGNFTVLDVMGTLTLATSWDQYVPAVFWLVLMLYFAYRIAPLPFFASFFGLGAAISPIPYAPLAFVAAIMLLVIAIVVNALTQWGVALAERVISAARARVVSARR